MGLIVVLELAAVEVARGAKLVDLLLRLICSPVALSVARLSSRISSRRSLSRSSYCRGRMRGKGSVGARRGDVRPREAREGSGAGGLIRGERTWVTKKMGMPRPAPRPMKAATPIVMVSSSSSASWASSTACEGNRAGGRAGQIDRDRDRRARVWSEGTPRRIRGNGGSGARCALGHDARC